MLIISDVHHRLCHHADPVQPDRPQDPAASVYHDLRNRLDHLYVGVSYDWLLVFPQLVDKKGH